MCECVCVSVCYHAATSAKGGGGGHRKERGASLCFFFCFFITLGLELSDTKVYESVFAVV